MPDLDPSPPITGHCLCGRVCFEVSEPFVDADYCHCNRCQRRTGSAFSASAEPVPGSFRVSEGEELLRAFRPGDGWHDFFCGECGGHLYAQSHIDPDRLSVSMGAIDGDPGVRPSYHQFVAYAVAWQALPDDGLPRYDEGAPG